MLLDNKFLLINKLKITLSFDDNVSKSFIINVNDIIGVSYKQGNNTLYIKGKIDEINCNFNSSLGRIESSVFIKVDGSEEYNGKVVYIKPDCIIDLNVFEVDDMVVNPVVSVDNNSQRILMIRENEIKNFQYSKDGLTWSNVGGGAQGLSAYEVAVEFGFEGSELMWLESLKGRRGNTGPKGSDGKSAYQVAVDNGFVGTEEDWLESLKGEKGDTGDSAYQVAVDNGFVGTEEEWLASLRGDQGNVGETGSDGDSAYQVAVNNGFAGTQEDWVASLKGEKGNTGSKGATGKSAYQFALDNGFSGTEAEWVASLKGDIGEKGDEGKSAYQVATDAGFQGTYNEWLVSLKGDKGLDGADGINGDNGKSAYQIAVDNGFVGTEAEWLVSLKGEPSFLDMSFEEQFTGRYDPYNNKIYVKTFAGTTSGTGSQIGELLSDHIKRVWNYHGMFGTTENKQPIGSYIATSANDTFAGTIFPRLVYDELYLYHNLTDDGLSYEIEVEYTKTDEDII